MNNEYVNKLIEAGVILDTNEFYTLVDSLRKQIAEMNMVLSKTESKCNADDYIFGFFTGCLYTMNKNNAK